jgi:hypothetical protein
MGLASKGPKLFTCPKCRKTYLGHDPLPDCPSCGYDYRAKGGFRWDVLVYLLSVLGMLSYFLVSSSYRSLITESASTSAGPASQHSTSSSASGGEKLPGADRAPFVYPPERGADR